MAAKQPSLPPHTDELYDSLAEAPLVVPLPLVMYQMRKAGQGPIATSIPAEGGTSEGSQPEAAMEPATDARMAQIISFASQRFLAAVLNDALQEQKRSEIESNNALKRSNRLQQDVEPGRTLTTKDLSHALKEYGIKVAPPPYYVGTSTQTGARQR